MLLGGGTSLWALAHIRRRLTVLAALGLLAGLAGAATLTAVAGARRASSTYERFTAATDGPDVVVSTFTAVDRWKPSDHLLEPFGDLPGVTAWARVVMMAMRPVGSDAYVFDTFNFGATDASFARDIRRFQIVKGRRFDDARDDEVVVSTQYAEQVGVDVGDEIEFETWTDDIVAGLFAGTDAGAEPPTGPVMRATVVGITREFEPLVPFTEEPLTAYFPRGFTRRWGQDVGSLLPVGLVRLDGGQRAVSEFESAARELAATIDPDLPDGLLIELPNSAGAGVQESIDAQVAALLVFALIAGAVGIVVTYTVLGHQLSFASDDQPALRAMGATRPQRLAGILVVGAPIALVAICASVAGAVAASTLLPIGTPGDLEPHPGLRFDVAVLCIGAVAVVVIVLALVTWAGVALTRAPEDGSSVARLGPARSVGRWLGFLPPVSIGVGMAFERGRGGRALPVRMTVAGCVVGIAGAVAALSFAASLDHLVSTPRLYGLSADAAVEVGSDEQAWQEVLQELEADPDVDQVTTYIGVGYLTLNEQPVFGVLYEPTRGDTLNVIVSGRAPQARDELVMGRAVADELDVEVGDLVSVALADGTSRDYELVGIAAHPPIEGTYRDHVALPSETPEEFDTSEGAPTLGAVFSLRSGADGSALIDALREQGVATYDVGSVRPRTIASLDEVRVFPFVLAVLLTCLTATALLYALSMGPRRRRRELAVLRTLGFSGTQIRLVSAVQGLTLAGVGFVIGVPLGVAAGRMAWTALAHRLGVVVDHVLPGPGALWGVGVIVAVIVASSALGRRVVRTRPAELLRPGDRE